MACMPPTRVNISSGLTVRVPGCCRSYEKNSETVSSLMKEVKDMSALYETTVQEEEVSRPQWVLTLASSVAADNRHSSKSSSAQFKESDLGLDVKGHAEWLHYMVWTLGLVLVFVSAGCAMADTETSLRRVLLRKSGSSRRLASWTLSGICRTTPTS